MSALSRTICSSRRDVGVELGEPLVELGLAGAHAAGLFLDLGAGDRQALEGGRSGRASASRSSGRRCAPIACSLAAFICAGARSATSAVAIGQRRLRLRLPAPWPASSADAAASPRRLRISADRFLKREAWRAWRFRLSIWLSSSPTHVVEPLEILLGGAQPQLGLVAAGVQAGDAGRLFEQRAARLRLGLDQLADAALPDHRGRARAGRLVGEQQLHVLGARFLAVDAVDRARPRARCGATPAIRRRR